MPSWFRSIGWSITSHISHPYLSDLPVEVQFASEVWEHLPRLTLGTLWNPLIRPQQDLQCLSILNQIGIVNPPTPLAVQGVLGAGQAGIIVSQSSHRNQFIALLGRGVVLFRGKTSYASRAMGESVLEVHFWTISARTQTSQKRTPTMLKNPLDQQRITSIIAKKQASTQGHQTIKLALT